jgi:hypothetical protein
MTLNADISQRNCHVRFTPDNDRESEFPQTVMSALPPKADMCSATMDVRYGPKADISEQAPKAVLLVFRAFTRRFIHGNEVSPGNLCREPAAVA